MSRNMPSNLVVNPAPHSSRSNWTIRTSASMEADLHRISLFARSLRKKASKTSFAIRKRNKPQHESIASSRPASENLLPIFKMRSVCLASNCAETFGFPSLMKYSKASFNAIAKFTEFLKATPSISSQCAFSCNNFSTMSSVSAVFMMVIPELLTTENHAARTAATSPTASQIEYIRHMSCTLCSATKSCTPFSNIVEHCNFTSAFLVMSNIFNMVAG
mmetsp:Transcript_51892/g.118047  ORF Transcript_51892/g.118047 Transcript_51892/m.118047 type:complete len:218 (-) Transcript_51892:416-1069(-)